MTTVVNSNTAPSLYTIQAVSRLDPKPAVLIQPGTTGVVFDAKGPRILPNGLYRIVDLLRPNLSSSNLYIVPKTLRLVLRMHAISRDGWVAPLTLQAVYTVTDAVALIEQSDPSGDWLRSILTSVVLQVVNRYSALQLVGYGRQPVGITEILQAIRTLHAAEYQAHSLPGLSVEEIYITQPWSNSTLVAHLKRQHLLLRRAATHRRRRPPS